MLELAAALFIPPSRSPHSLSLTIVLIIVKAIIRRSLLEATGQSQQEDEVMKHSQPGSRERQTLVFSSLLFDSS